MNAIIFRICAIVAFWLASPYTTFIFASGNDDLFERFKQSQAQSELRLHQFKEFQDSPLESVVIGSASIHTNVVKGTIPFGKSDVDACLIRTDAKRSDAWLLAIKLDRLNAADLIPGAKGDAVGISMDQPMIVFATADYKISSQTPDQRVNKFFKSYLASENEILNIERGVNILANARVDEDSDLGRKMKVAKIDIPKVVLQGIIFRDFTANDFKRSKSNGSLFEKTMSALELRARIPGFKIKTLPANCASGQASLVLTGKPSIGIEFDMTVDSDGNRRDFECQLQLIKTKTGSKLAVLGKAKGEKLWEDAMGIKGVDLNAIDIQLSVDSQQKAAFEIKAAMMLGNRSVNVLGGAEFHTVSGAPIRSYFKGELDRLSRDDLVAIANRVSDKLNAGKIRTESIPDFELRDLKFVFAPLGGSDELGIEAGYVLKGDMYVDGSKFAFVDVQIDQSRESRIVKAKGAIERLKLGDLTIEDASVDIRLAEKNSHYFLRGKIQVFESYQKIELQVTDREMIIKLNGQLAGQYDTKLVYKAKRGNQPSWQVAGAIEGDLNIELGGNLSNSISDWAVETSSKARDMDADLKRLQRTVENLQRDIEVARREVRDRRQRQQQTLNSALQRVEDANQKVASLRRQVSNERTRKLAGLKSNLDSASRALRPLRSAKDSKYRAYTKAKRSYDKAKNPIDKAKKKAKMLSALAKYKTSKAKYEVAKKAYDKAKDAYEDAAREINRIPVDGDPRVVAAKASLRVANAGLRAAQETVNLAQRIPVDATPKVRAFIESRKLALLKLNRIRQTLQEIGGVAQKASRLNEWQKRNGALIVIQSIEFDAALSSVQGAGKIKLMVDAKIAGERKMISVSVDSSSLTRENLAQLIQRELRKKLI